MQHTHFLSWSRNLYIIGLFLAVTAIIPSVWFPFQLGKLAVFSLFLLVAVVLFVVGGGVSDFLKAKGVRVGILIAGIPVAYVTSYMFSIDRSVGWFGYAIESDTILFSILIAFTFLISYALFRTDSSVRSLMVGVLASITVAALVQYLVVLFGQNLIAFQIFSDRSTNLVGKWNDFGLLVGLMLLFMLVWMEFMDTTFVRRALVGAGALVLVLLLAIVQFPLAWSMLFGFSLLLALWSFVSNRGSEGRSATPWLPLTAATISAFFLLWGSSFNSGIANMFPVSSLEVRPSFTSSLDMVKAAHADSLSQFLFGTGPQTFGQIWLIHKPLAVNQSPFWNLDFTVGFSTLVTTLESVGVLGMVSWIIPLFLVLIGLLRAVRSSAFSPKEKIIALSLGMGATYLWTTILFYVPSQNIVLLMFALCGAAYGYSTRAHGHEGVHIEEQGAGTAKITRRIVSLVLITLSLFLSVTIVRRFLAETYTNQGIIALQSGNVDEALTFSTRAKRIEVTGNALRLSVDAGNAKLQQMAVATNAPTKEQQDQFTAQLQKTITEGQRAFAMNPNDYRAYVSLARVYDFLATLKVSGAYESAKQTYQAATTHNPTNPVIALALARVEATHGNEKGLEDNITRALTLKPDYTDAILLVVQLEVARKDIPNAIRAAQAAVRSAPGVAPLWFQLGLLYYASNDTASAITVLEQAVKIQGDYANAKYFLGLSYAAQRRVPDAVQQFMDLQKSNPDNKEVALILANLTAGKTPFEGATPPVTPTPQTRNTAPISQ